LITSYDQEKRRQGFTGSDAERSYKGRYGKRLDQSTEDGAEAIRAIVPN
jgi:hypothetical protein